MSMKPQQLGALKADLPPLEEDLAARMEIIFERPAAKHVLRGRTFARTLH